MVVTAVEELSKSRSKVYIDREFAFVLYKGELRQYKLEVGEEIKQSDYNEIMKSVLPKRAKLRAMNLLQKREYTEKQLRDKLKEGYYPEQIIQTTLDYVASYHYTDDLRYAVSYISDHENSRSKRRIEQDLQNKGINRTTLSRAWEEWEKQGGCQNESAMICRLLEKRGYRPETTNLKEKQKIFRFLLGKGFSADAIQREMKV